MKRPWAALLGTGMAIVALCAADGPQKEGSRPPVPGGAPTADSAGRSEDENAIRTGVASFARAFRDRDARAIARMFAEDGEAVDSEGGTIQGRAAIERTTQLASRTSRVTRSKPRSSPSSSSRRVSRGKPAARGSCPPMAGRPPRADSRQSM